MTATYLQAMTADEAARILAKSATYTSDMREIVSAKRMLEDADAPRAPEREPVELDPEAAGAWEALEAAREPATPSTANLLEEVKAALERFVVFVDEHQAVAVAVWVLHTYIFSAFDTTPYLYVNSATKQSGKTRLFEVLVLLVSKPWMLAGASASILFRKIDKEAPTLLLDEVDTLFGDDPEMTSSIRGIINAGYRRGGVIARTVGQGANFEPKDFTVFCPKAFAGIGNRLPDTVADRSIPIALKRRSPTEREPDRFRQARATAELAPLAMQLRAWGRTHAKSIGASEPLMPLGLSDRQQDGWEPLFAIAALAGGDWPQRVEYASLALHEAAEDGDLAMHLLVHARDAFDELGERLTTFKLLEHLVNRGDASPWAHWWGEDVEEGGARVKKAAQGLARKLQPLGIKPAQIWLGGKKYRGYERSDFEDSWARYLAFTVPDDSEVGRSVDSRSEPVFGSDDDEPKSAPEQDSTDLPTQPPPGTVRADYDDPDSTFWSTAQADAYLASMGVSS